jgi:hypothetical protein
MSSFNGGFEVISEITLSILKKGGRVMKAAADGS